jgi:hypothetical protein
MFAMLTPAMPPTNCRRDILIWILPGPPQINIERFLFFFKSNLSDGSDK